MDLNFLISSLDFLIKYNSYQTVLSIIFSLVIAALYYLFWTRGNIRELKKEHEKEILKEQLNFKEEKSKLKDQYENKIETLNNKIIERDKEIQDLKFEMLELKNQHYVDSQIVQYSRRENNE